MKVGANSNIGVSTLLAEGRKPSPVGVQEPNASSRDGLDHIHHVRIDTVDVVGVGYKRIDFLQLVHTRDTGRRKVRF
jgi:hypothetical protein